MTAEQIVSIIWELVNSPVVVAALVSATVWALNRIYARVPIAKQFEGSLIAAVKFAEKAIPDSTENKAAARLDCALKYAVRVLEGAQGKAASPAQVAELKEGIQVAHADLEAAGILISTTPEVVR